MKVSIYGAGRVGVSVAFSLMHRGLIDEIVLIDVDREKAEGEALDLMHSSAMFKRCDVKVGSSEDVAGSDFVVITAGYSQKPGETRLDLVEGNLKIIKHIAHDLRIYANDSIIINVTNPVDVLTYFIWKYTGFDSKKVIGSGTTLDTSRLRVLLSKSCNISPNSIHAYVIGEHGDSEFVPFSLATIGGLKLVDYCKQCKNFSDSSANFCPNLEKIVDEVKLAAYKIIEKKGATNLAIGSVVGSIIESMIKDEKRVWTPSVLYEDVYIGYPAVLSRNGVERILKLTLSEEENVLFEKSLNTIKSVIIEMESKKI